jgi:hypothetical protein
MLVPRPTPGLAASIVPPCSSTKVRAIASPTPKPPWRRTMVGSAWLKRSKTFGMNFDSIPSPLSSIRNVKRSSEHVLCALIVPPCDRIVQKLAEDLFHAIFIAENIAGLSQVGA